MLRATVSRSGFPCAAMIFCSSGGKQLIAFHWNSQQANTWNPNSNQFGTVEAPRTQRSGNYSRWARKITKNYFVGDLHAFWLQISPVLWSVLQVVIALRNQFQFKAILSLCITSVVMNMMHWNLKTLMYPKAADLEVRNHDRFYTSENPLCFIWVTF